MLMKKPGYLLSFMRLQSRKCSSRSSGGGGGADGGGGSGGETRRRWSLKNISSGLRWKRKSPLMSFQIWLVDGILFKILSFFEGVFLVSTLAFFYLCCGCHI